MKDSKALDHERLLAHSGWVRSLARTLVRGDDVDDLVQDTWRTALERAPRVDDARGLRAWLRRVVKNLAIDRRRAASAKAWHVEHAPRNEPERPDEAAERVALQQKLVQALLALDEPYRSALIWRYVDGLDAREIARRQGVSPEAARKRISRGLAALRERFDREHRGGRAEWCAFFSWIAEPPQMLVRSYLAWKVIAALVVAALAGGVWWLSASSSSRTPMSAATPGFVSVAPEPLAMAPTDAPGTRISAGSPLAGSSASSTDATLRGRVLDADGLPKSGARVDVFANEFAGFALLDRDTQTAREHLATLPTNDQGEFVFQAELGRLYDVEAAADDVRAAPRFDVSAGMDVTLELRAMGSLYGRVVRLERAEPIAGVRVEATFRPDRRTQDRALAVATTTDEQGVYRFESLAPGPYELRAEPADAPSVSSSVTVRPGESTARNLVVKSGRTVRGRVVDASTAAPIVGALVSDRASFARAVATEAQGEFVLAGVPSRSDAWLRARAPGYGVSTIRVAQDVEPVLVTMQRASTWRGRVVDELGAPLADAYVAAVALEVLEADRGRGVQQSDRIVTRTDSQGAFELVDVRTDVTHWLFARKPGFGTRWIAVPKEPETDRELPDVVLEPSAAIAIRVIDEHGASVAGAWVWIRGTAASSSAETAPLPALLERLGVREARTAADGSARIADLSRGAYEVKASLRPGGSLAIGNVVLAASGDVQVLELELARGRAIRGRVVDGAGRPLDAGVELARAELATWSRAERLLGSESISTDGDGYFEFEILGSPSCRLTVFPQETDSNGEPLYPPRCLGAVEPGGKPLEVRLEASVRVSGRVLDADGVPVAGCVVRLDRKGSTFASGIDYVETDAEGGFRLLLEPADRAVIRAEWPARFSQPPYASELRRVTFETPVPAPDEVEIRFAWRVADGAPEGGGK